MLRCQLRGSFFFCPRYLEDPSTLFTCVSSFFASRIRRMQRFLSRGARGESLGMPFLIMLFSFHCSSADRPAIRLSLFSESDSFKSMTPHTPMACVLMSSRVSLSWLIHTSPLEESFYFLDIPWIVGDHFAIQDDTEGSIGMETIPLCLTMIR